MSPEEFMSRYESVGNSHDLEAILGLIADNAIYLFSNQTTHIGKDAIRNAIQANFDTIKTRNMPSMTLLGSQSPIISLHASLNSIGRERSMANRRRVEVAEQL